MDKVIKIMDTRKKFGVLLKRQLLNDIIICICIVMLFITIQKFRKETYGAVWFKSCTLQSWTQK